MADKKVMEILDRDSFVEALRRKAEEVEITAEGAGVVVTELDAVTFYELWNNSEYEGEKEGVVNFKTLAPALLVECVVDREGKKILNQEDVDILREANRHAYATLVGVAFRLNGITAEKN